MKATKQIQIEEKKTQKEEKLTDEQRAKRKNNETKTQEEPSLKNTVISNEIFGNTENFEISKDNATIKAKLNSMQMIYFKKFVPVHTYIEFRIDKLKGRLLVGVTDDYEICSKTIFYNNYFSADRGEFGGMTYYPSKKYEFREGDTIGLLILQTPIVGVGLAINGEIINQGTFSSHRVKGNIKPFIRLDTEGDQLSDIKQIFLDRTFTN